MKGKKAKITKDLAELAYMQQFLRVNVDRQVDDCISPRRGLCMPDNELHTVAEVDGGFSRGQEVTVV